MVPNYEPTIEFAHIAPTAYLDDFCTNNNTDLVLAHLLLEDPVYAEWHRKHDAYKIMDNSAFELYKAGKPPLAPDLLVGLADKVEANCLVLPDYPAEGSQRTINAADAYAPLAKAAGYDTMFVPQSRSGDLADYLTCWDYAVRSPDVDLIGLSILGAPNAFDVEHDNKLQRFLARRTMLGLLETSGLLNILVDTGKQIHLLGASDGVIGELDLLHRWFPMIRSQDSSAAVWYGIHGDQVYDNTPTRQRHGKYEEPVDFGYTSATDAQVAKAHVNVRYVDRACGLSV